MHGTAVSVAVRRQIWDVVARLKLLRECARVYANR
jgi:hypothetical protein